jgi:hypothetical protein
LKLTKKGITLLGLEGRLPVLVRSSGFTAHDFNRESYDHLYGDVLFAYIIGYIGWDKPYHDASANWETATYLQFAIENPTLSAQVDNDEVKYFKQKYEKMMNHAFQLGRDDADMSPCPYSRTVYSAH